MNKIFAIILYYAIFRWFNYVIFGMALDTMFFAWLSVLLASNALHSYSEDLYGLFTVAVGIFCLLTFYIMIAGWIFGFHLPIF